MEEHEVQDVPPILDSKEIETIEQEAQDNQPDLIIKETEQIKREPPGATFNLDSKKKERIILLSLKRRAELEAKKAIRQEEIARKREQEAILKESQEQRKLERKKKQEAILENYRQNKKAAEELERNGSSSTNHNNNNNNNNHHNVGNHHKSLSTGGSITNLSSASSSSSQVSHNNNQQPNSNHRIPRDIKSAPSHHTSVWNLYTGPKLFAKPTVKTNLIIIHNAILKSLEGAANAKTLRRMQETIDAHSKTCNHFLILFRNRTSFRGLFQYDEKQNTITRLDGSGPKSINPDDIVKFYKFDSPKRQFSEVQTKQISLTIIAITIHDHLWSKTTT